MNALVLSFALAFFLSIVIGRAVTTITRAHMVGALETLDSALDRAAVENAGLESLLTLLPVFDVFVTEGMRLFRQEMVCVKVWCAWAFIAILVSPLQYPERKIG